MARIQVWIPNWLDRICAWPVIVYRRRKYGYSYRKIYLGEGQYTIVEPVDYYRFRDYQWHFYGNGTGFYAIRSIVIGPGKSTVVGLTKEIMNPPEGLIVDHRNRNPLDNRRANLRLATHAENMHNRRKKENTTSKYVGVHWHKMSGKWEVEIRYKRKRKYLGGFDNEIEAAKAYDAAAKQYYGDFARLNFPETA